MSRSLFLAVMTATAPALGQAFAEPRTLYDHQDGGCYHVTDRAECCQHRDGRNSSNSGVGYYYSERCVPSAVGKSFTSGRVCEPECFVQGLCGDGPAQGDRMGQCLDLDFDDSVLMISEDNSPSTMTTTFVWPGITTVAGVQPSHALSHKDKVIAGAVAGSVGGVALLGGLLGGLLTTTVPPALVPSRFLEGHDRAADSNHTSITQRLGAPLIAVLALGAVVALAGSAVVKSWRHGARDVLGSSSDLEESTDDEDNMGPTTNSPPDTFDSAFDIVVPNHDGTINQEEFNSAFKIQRTVYSLQPAVYVQQPMCEQRGVLHINAGDHEHPCALNSNDQ